MEHFLDVSELEPCKPLEQALSASRSLPEGDYLRVLHRREPNMLFPLLEKAGFSSHCRGNEAAGFEIFIWRKNDSQAEQQVSTWAQKTYHPT